MNAIADPNLSPVVLIAEDFAARSGPIFGPAFLKRELYPHVRFLTEAWHAHGIKVLFHSDGSWRRAIPELVDCGVDSSYCLEPACGMRITELARDWPGLVWAGGIDGVHLMELASPGAVRAEVHRIISEVGMLERGGVFIDTSSEINPSIPRENSLAVVAAVREMRNTILAR